MCGTTSGRSGCPGGSRWWPSSRLGAAAHCATRSPTTTSSWCAASLQSALLQLCYDGRNMIVGQITRYVPRQLQHFPSLEDLPIALVQFACSEKGISTQVVETLRWQGLHVPTLNFSSRRHQQCIVSWLTCASVLCADSVYNHLRVPDRHSDSLVGDPGCAHSTGGHWRRCGRLLPCRLLHQVGLHQVSTLQPICTPVPILLLSTSALSTVMHANFQLNAWQDQQMLWSVQFKETSSLSVRSRTL